jgi:TolB-like protein
MQSWLAMRIEHRSFLLALSLAFTTLGLVAVEQPQGEPKGPTLSILYFDNTTKSPDFDWLRTGLSDMLTADIAASGAVTVVEREKLAEVLKEQELQLSGIVGDEDAVRVGGILAAKRIVYGSFIVMGKSLRVEARLVDTQSAAILGAVSAEGGIDEALALERKIAVGMLNALGIQARAAPSSGGTSRPEAAAAYYRGLAALDSGAYKEAETRFMEASALDPAYAKPQAGLEAAYRFLKDFKRQRQQHELAVIASSLQRLRSRVEGRFYSFSDMVARPKDFGLADAQAASAAYSADPRGYAGESPVQAMWNMQMLLLEMGQKADAYFSDKELSARCNESIEALAAAAERQFPKDPFLAEALYAALIPLRQTGRWAELKVACERIMADWPDYRMGQSVEDMYEAALDKLSGKN